MKKSAGILLFRLTNAEIEFMLTHPGGPFYLKKDLGAWSIPKGEFSEPEDPLMAAKREFLEEIGMEIEGKFIALTPTKMKSGKIIYAWAVENDIDCSNIKSNIFKIEWPPRSGKFAEFPEVDAAEWFNYKMAEKKIHNSQMPFLNEILKILNIRKQSDSAQQSLFD